MNEKKHYLTLALAILLALGILLLAACHEETGTTGETQTEAATEKPTETQTEAHQHTPETDAGKPATCTEPGLTEGSHCSACGEILTERQEIPATGHQYLETVVPPTETESGYTAHVCVSCGDAYVDIIPPTASVGLEFCLNPDGQSYTVKGEGTCTDTEIVIPSVHDGKPVTGIDSHAFAYCTHITSVTIPDSVTNVGEGAFWECWNLVRIEGPEDIVKEIRYSIRKKSSVCYVGPDAYGPASRFYDSLEEAIAHNPDGAVIKFCNDVTDETPFHCPDTAEYILIFSGYEINITPDSGVALEYWSGGNVYQVYTNRLSAVFEEYSGKLSADNNPQLWVFAETDGLAAGRYTVTNVNEQNAAEPEYRFDYLEDLSGWGRKYVANAIWDDKTYYFYTLQEAMDAAQAGNSYARINIMRDCEATLADGILELPYTGFYYRIPYNYHYVDGRFTRGVTYDDMNGGYCFYSSLDFLSIQPSLAGTCCWIWGVDDGFVPGKYYMTANSGNLGSEADVFDPETGLYYVMHVGQYVYTLVEGSNIDDFFEEMRYYVDRGY